MFQSAPFSTGAARPAIGSLGQVEQQWFARAKTAVAKFDELEARARSIAAPGVRSQVFSEFVGDAADPESALYRRNSVAYNVAQAESYTPINYLVFDSRQQNRVEKLEDWVRKLDTEVVAAEKLYGTLPEPVVVERVVERTTAPAASNLTVPIVAGAFALIVLGYLVFGD
jgi:hypothetical protein